MEKIKKHTDFLINTKDDWSNLFINTLNVRVIMRCYHDGWGSNGDYNVHIDVMGHSYM